MISIDIHRQRFSKNWRLSCRFVLSPWGNYRELTVQGHNQLKQWHIIAEIVNLRYMKI